jgi:hypothetical protein
MNLDDILPLLSHEAEEFALKIEAFCKDTEGRFLQPVRLTHKKDTYYWCEMYLFPWEKNEKNQFYVYCHHLFLQGTVVLVPEDEIQLVGFN